MEVALCTVKLVPSTPPNQVCVVPVKLAPVSVTTVPPAAGPEEGETLVMLTEDGTEAAQATRSEIVLSAIDAMTAPPTDPVSPAGEAEKMVELTMAGFMTVAAA
jgi:hypothetical protein